MNILIDMQAVQSGSRHGGIGRYSMNLLEFIHKNSSTHSISLLINTNLPMDNISKLESMVSKNNIYYFTPIGDTKESLIENEERANISKIIRENKIATINPDFLLIMSLFEGLDESVVTSIGEVFPSERTAVILYDLIPLVESEKYLNTDLTKKHYMSKIDYLKKAGLLLSISQFSKDEAIELLNIQSEKIVNISSAIDNKFQKITISQKDKKELYNKYGIKNQFIMFTGSYDLRKNQKRLIEAYDKLPSELKNEYQLVIIGNGPKSTIDTIKLVVKELNIDQSSVLFLENINDKDLLLFYNLASLFVFPTLREGFGLPALEAMQCAIPTIGSNTTSIPEVIGREDALFDPMDVNSIAIKIEQVLKDKDFRIDLISHGIRQSKKFSWDISSIKVLEALEEKSKHIKSNKEVKTKKLPFISPQPLKLQIKSLPIIGWFTRWLYNLSRLNNLKHTHFMLQQKVDQLEINFIDLKKQMESKLEQSQKHLESKLEQSQKHLESKLLQSQKQIALISTWNTKCGIASYSKELIKTFDFDVTVLAPFASSNDLVNKDEVNVSRCWSMGNDTLEILFNQIQIMGIRKVFIQFNYGFFNFIHLNSFILKLHSVDVEVFMTLHSTSDDLSLDNKKLNLLTESFKLLKKIFVHTKKDLENLSTINIQDNVELFKQGIVDLKPIKDDYTIHTPFRLATYGFFLKSKGLLEIIETVRILKEQNINISLLMQNAKYSDAASNDLVNSANDLITKYNLESVITIDTEYKTDQDTIDILSSADLIVFPYQNTGESSSAAVRTAIASKSLIAVTPQPIFDELEDVVFRFSGSSSTDIAKGIKNIIDNINSNDPIIEEKTKLQSRWIKEHSYLNISKSLREKLSI